MLATFCMGIAIKQTQVMRLTELCIVAIIQIYMLLERVLGR